ncbi:MAG: iron ABC transporter permease, partial [Chloroflexi bacterium]|nr:iron ABC transporter permease [Chloroflexota bacterium]
MIQSAVRAVRERSGLGISVERRRDALYLLFLILPLPLAVYAVGLGRYEIAPDNVVRTLVDYVTVGHNASAQPDLAYDIVIRIRLPRVAAAMLIGGSLAVTGAAFQG